MTGKEKLVASAPTESQQEAAVRNRGQGLGNLITNKPWSTKPQLISKTNQNSYNKSSKPDLEEIAGKQVPSTNLWILGMQLKTKSVNNKGMLLALTRVL